MLLSCVCVHPEVYLFIINRGADVQQKQHIEISVQSKNVQDRRRPCPYPSLPQNSVREKKLKLLQNT